LTFKRLDDIISIVEIAQQNKRVVRRPQLKPKPKHQLEITNMNSNVYSFSGIRKQNAIPAKVRSTKESALATQIKKLSRVGHSFLIENVKLSNVAPTVYATARRLGCKVSLRTEGNGVGVFLTQQAPASTEDQAAAPTAKRGPGRPPMAAKAA
jgi:hypothetical protein